MDDLSFGVDEQIIKKMSSAISNNDINIIRELIVEMPILSKLIREQRYRKNFSFSIRSTFLMDVCFFCDINKITIEDAKKKYEIIKLLLDSGAEIDEKDLCGITTLHRACRMLSNITNYGEEISREFSKIIELLLEKGANFITEDIFGFTPLHSLFEYGVNETILDIAEVLIKKGADVNKKVNYDDDEEEFTLLEQILSYECLHNWLVKDLEKSNKIYDRISKFIILMFDSGLNIDKNRLYHRIMVNLESINSKSYFEVVDNHINCKFSEVYFDLIKTISEYDLRKELTKKDEEIAKLKKENEELKYRPGNQGYIEAAQDFDKLINGGKKMNKKKYYNNSRK